MDPLSLTASLIAVIQVTGAVVSTVYNYRKDVKSAPEDAAAIVRELTALSGVLDNVLRMVEAERFSKNGQSSHLAAVRRLAEAGGLLESCRNTLGDLNAKLQPKDGWRAIKQSLVWPLKQSYVKKTLEAIATAKATLTFALTADQTSATLEVKENLDALISSFEAFRFDEARKSALENLSPTDPTLNHLRSRKKYQDGTGAWLTGSDQYKEWIGRLGSVLWINGIPGCGKTMLCSIVIEDLLQNIQPNKSQVGVAYYYFSFQEQPEQQFSNMLRSLLLQLACQCRETPKGLRNLTLSEEGACSPHLLTGVLQETLASFQEVFITIDAIDECEQYEEALQWIQNIAGEKNRLHLLVSSRRDYRFHAVLDTAATSILALDDHLFADDIELYIATRLEADSRMRKWPADTKAKVKDSLITNSGGLFRWVECQLDALQKCLRIKDIQRILETPPKSLNEQYDRIVESIDEAYFEDASRILQWLCYSARPLRTNELNEVLAFDRSDNENPKFDAELRLPVLDDVLSLCSSLIVVSKEASSDPEGSIVDLLEVRLAHNSVKDYLLSKTERHQRLNHVVFEPIVVHAAVAECCIVYLLQLDKDLGCMEVSVFPLTSYAAQFWTSHYNQSDPSRESLSTRLAYKLLTEPVAYRNTCLLRNSRKGSSIQENRDANMPALYHAAMNNMYHVTSLLLMAGADPNESTSSWACTHATPLGAAAFSGNTELVQLLLKSGANPDGVRYPGRYGSPAGAAAVTGRTTVIQILVEAGANLNDEGDGYYGSPLLAAARYKQRDTVDYLLSNGADPSAYEGWSSSADSIDYAILNNDNETLALFFPLVEEDRADWILKRIAHSGRRDVFESLLKTERGKRLGLKYAEVAGLEDLVRDLVAEHAQTKNSNTIASLLATASSESMEAVQLLFENIPDRTVTGDEVTNALAAAVGSGKGLIVKYLIDRGADVRAKQCEEALVRASAYGWLSSIQFMLEAGANVNACGKLFPHSEPGSCLHAAVEFGRLESARLLLSYGANFDTLCGDGSVLHNSTNINVEAFFDLLIESNVQLTKLRTKAVAYDSPVLPLQVAVSKGDAQIVSALLSRGAQVDEVAIEGGWTALFLAARHGHENVLPILLGHGADPLRRAHGGSLPIQAAAFHGHIACVRFFLSSGVDVDIRGRFGRTALHWAAIEAQADMVRFLLENGADPTLRDEGDSMSAADFARTKILELDELSEQGHDVSQQTLSQYKVILMILEINLGDVVGKDEPD